MTFPKGASVNDRIDPSLHFIRHGINYLDNFLCIGPAKSRVCFMLLHTMERVSVDFGVPLV